MSYLAQYATPSHRPSRRPCRRAHAAQPAGLTAARACACSSRTRVGLRDVDVSGHGAAPRIRLRIADCVNEANLEFSVEKAESSRSCSTRSTRCSARFTASATRSLPRAKPRARRECGHTSEREEGRRRT